MFFKRLVLVSSLLGVALAGAFPAVASADAGLPTMTIVDLGTFGGHAQAVDINDAGQVAITGSAAAYLWQNGVATQIPGSEWADAINGSGEVLETPFGSPPNVSLISAGGSTRPLSGFDLTDVNTVSGSDINDHDAVAGVVVHSSTGFGPTFLWKNGAISLITPADLYAQVAAVNNLDQVVGFHSSAQNGTAFVWRDGVLTDLPPLATSCPYGAGQANALDINDNSVIVGTSLGSEPNCIQSAVVWQGGSVTELPRFANSLDHYVARAINQQGVIAGSVERSNSSEPWEHQAVQWVNGQIQALGGLDGLNSVAYAINSSGVVAGYADDAAGVWHAVLWTPPLPPAQPQTISFGSLANVPYGQAPMTLLATASSGLPVSFSATGACAVSGGSLSITGAGTCLVTANQAGNLSWLPAAPVTQSFSIGRAQLMVTPDRLTKVVKAANPRLTTRISGFVNGETLATSGVTGTASCSTTASSASGVGSYPINCSQGTLASTNYAFNFASGSLNVVYGFKGFLQPINDTGHATCGATCPMSVFKAGSVVPVRFQLFDANNHVVKAGSLPVWVTPVKVGPNSQPVNECVSSEKASTGSTFRLDDSTYFYNWSTKGFAAGYVYKISAMLDDGTVQSVYVGLK